MPTRTTSVLAVLALVPLLLAGCDQASSSPKQAKSQQPAPTQVGVVIPKKQSVPYVIRLPGRATAYRTAEIRPQVDGLVRKRVFTEGHEVKAGDVLYKLDASKFEAAKAAAAAAVQKAQANVANAKGKYDRTKELAQHNAASKQDLDNAQSTLLQAEADLASARAALQTAQINLDDATIRAPISGLIGKSQVNDGALVTADQTTALATIRQLDPIYVDLVQSAANLLRIRAKMRAGNLGRNHKGPPDVTLTLEDGSEYPETGKMDLAEVTVSQSTGTFALRAKFPNPDHVLLPGMFVRATVDLGQTPHAYLVPEQAVDHDTDGNPTVFVVGANDKVKTQKIETDRIYDNQWVVTGGLSDNTKIVVDGLQYISDGTKVTPKLLEVGKKGNVPAVVPPGAENVAASGQQSGDVLANRKSDDRGGAKDKGE